MLCLHVSYVIHVTFRARGLAVLNINYGVQVWVYIPHYTRSKASSFREERRVRSSGSAIMQLVYWR